MFSWIEYLARQAYELALSAINLIVSWVDTLLSYARTKASEALSNAINYALNLYYSIKNTINYVISLISNTVNSIWQSVVSFVQRTVSPIWERIQGVINLLGQRIREVIDGFISPLQARIQPIIEWVRRLGDSIINGINWVFQTGMSLPGKIAELWNLLHNNIIPQITKFVQDTVPAVIDITSNPFGYVYPYLKEYLLELLWWLIAYGLGTTRLTLPPMPTFNFGGAGGALPDSESQALDISGLHSPLNSLWISGYRYREGHRALDLGLSNGDPVYAMHDGVVELVSRGYTGYGHQIVIRGTNWWTRYAHCLDILVEKDEPVRGGQLIALGDSTGNSTGPHLHLEIKYNGQFVDPVNVLPL